MSRAARRRGLAGLARLPAPLAVETLDNGLTLCLAPHSRGPVVATALWYRAGTAHEPPERAGLAHFLEHLMFKGSARFAPGEIDRRTQALGGSNGAFTTHDATVYYFDFSREHWTEALAIEADRMAGLRIDPGEVATERRVILEELAMSEDDPWPALEDAVNAELFGRHPYGRPPLGRRPALEAIEPDDLERFYRSHYGPDNAVLAVAGDFGPRAARAVREAFDRLEPLGRPPSPPPAPRFRRGPRRVERRRGEVPRLLVALPCPAADDPLYAPLRLLLTVLGGGRASRLHDLLVERLQLCLAVSTEISETVLPGVSTVAAELVPGAEPERVEAAVVEEIGRLHREPPAAAEIERARRLLVSDWVYSLETVEQLALAAGGAVALFDPGYPERHAAGILSAAAAELAEAAGRYLDLGRGGVVGWSRAGRRPEGGRG